MRNQQIRKSQQTTLASYRPSTDERQGWPCDSEVHDEQEGRQKSRQNLTWQLSSHRTWLGQDPPDIKRVSGDLFAGFGKFFRSGLEIEET